MIPKPAGARAALPRADIAARRRKAELGADDDHFLARLAPLLPRVPEPPEADTYLAVLDDALADRKPDAGETDPLVELAADLGIDRPTARDPHRGYPRSLAEAASEDGAIDARERADLEAIATAAGLVVTPDGPTPAPVRLPPLVDPIPLDRREYAACHEYGDRSGR